jgi:hypothetical protein
MSSLAAFLPPTPPAESAFCGVVQQGDLFEVLVQNGAEDVFFCPAVVWSVLEDGFEVYYLTRCHPNHTQETARCADQLLHVFEDHLENIPWQSVNAHVPLSHFQGDACEKRKRAFKQLGFRDLGSSNRFYKIAEEAVLDTVPALRGRQVEVGDIDSESDNDTEMDSDEEGDAEMLDEDGNLADLVVPDDQVELFTRAEGTAFAADMHRAQEEFDNWTPATEAQQKTKDLIDSMDIRLRREEANRAWARGQAM